MNHPLPPEHFTRHDRPSVPSFIGRLVRLGSSGLWLGALLFILSDLPWRLIGGTPLPALERLFLAGPLIAMPMVLYLSRPGTEMPLTHKVWVAGSQLYWVAAIGVFLGVVLAAVPVVGQANAIIWGLYTLVVSLIGLATLAEAPALSVRVLVQAAPFLFLPVGGLWFTSWSFGLQSFGFDLLIVLLTAIHFHFAGLVAPLLVSMPYRWCRKEGMEIGAEESIAGFGVVAGVPCVAIGIAGYHPFELVGAVLLSIGLIVNAYFVVRNVLPNLNRRLAKLLIVAGSLVPVVTMPIAVAYAYGRVMGVELVTMPTMILYHGVPNAIGFSLCTLVGWTMVMIREGEELSPAID